MVEKEALTYFIYMIKTNRDYYNTYRVGGGVALSGEREGGNAFFPKNDKRYAYFFNKILATNKIAKNVAKKLNIFHLRRAPTPYVFYFGAKISIPNLLYTPGSISSFSFTAKLYCVGGQSYYHIKCYFIHLFIQSSGKTQRHAKKRSADAYMYKSPRNDQICIFMLLFF